jgi:acyl-CoA thioesterase-1
MGAAFSVEVESMRFLLALLLAAPAWSAAATIMVFGDSLSSAYGLQRDQGWTTLLQQRIDEKKLDYKVANASISGDTTSGGSSRIDAALKTHRPSIVIIALGGNDGLRGIKPDAMRTNLDSIILASRRANAQVLLVGMRMPPNFGKGYSEKFQRVYADLARERKVPLAPFLLEGFADKPEFFQADGIHPNAQAQPLMLEVVWKALAPMLKVRR